MGFYYTRSNPDLGTGSWATYLSVWFYPALIILFFLPISKKVYFTSVAFMIIVVFVEFIFVGTRGGPILILLFFLFSKRKLYTKLFLSKVFLFLILFVIIFSYSTINRTQASSLGTFSWKQTLETTISTEIVSFKANVLEYVDKEMKILFPFIFLTHYISHSIGELEYLYSISNNISTGGANKFMEELCTIGICDKSYYFERAADNNSRTGVYSTIYSSFIYDFGPILGVFILFFLIILNMIKIILSKTIGPLSISLIVILAVSSIENYFYTGLGLIQFILVYVIYVFTYTINSISKYNFRRVKV